MPRQVEESPTTKTTLEVSVVIPAYNAAETLPRVLEALREAGDVAPIVIDAGSSDDTGAVARALGARVHRLPRRAGPAEARNQGVDLSDAEVVLFIDSDCVPHQDVVARVRSAFAADPDLVSLTGSYDADPPEQNFFSQYMNLRHHFTHQRARQEGASFWAGCGAVKRAAFLAVGGFDAARYPRPMIEDIELGHRIAAMGRTRLDPALQVTHLKHWTLRSVVETDIRHRAIPWAELILRSGSMPDDLNLERSQRVAAALAPVALSSPVLITLGALWAQPWIAAVAALCLGASLHLHRNLLAFFRNTRGASFAVRAWMFHQVHLTYSATTLAACAVYHFAPRTREESRSTDHRDPH
jgi:GT2 family glycosyltransferase